MIILAILEGAGKILLLIVVHKFIRIIILFINIDSQYSY